MLHHSLGCVRLFRLRSTTSGRLYLCTETRTDNTTIPMR